MDIAATVFGQTARLYSASLIVILLMAMLFMSLRLFYSRRKKAYFSLTVSLAVVIIQYAAVLYFSLNPTAGGPFYDRLSLLKVIAFVLSNMGVYQMYNPTRPRHYLFFYGLATVGIVLSLVPIPPLLGASAAGLNDNPFNPLLEWYLFVPILLFHYKLSKRIGQSGKYEFGLMLYALMQAALLANVYLFASRQKTLAAIESFFPVVFYFVLFMILFERVIELLQAVYTNSITDTLTGLYNRRYFLGRVQQYVRYGIPISVIFSDIDNFKRLNDTEGHHKGDEALKRVAQVLLDEIAEVGFAGRFGGEEMVALVTDPDADAADLAERIRRRVESETGVTVSIGFTKMRKGATADLLLQQADQAMYAAKAAGKNRVVKYTRKQQTPS